MNKIQHSFIWVGIFCVTLMAIALESKLFWLVALFCIIGESILICKKQPIKPKTLILLIIAIIIFLSAFFISLFSRQKRRRPLFTGSGIRRKPSPYVYKPNRFAITEVEPAATDRFGHLGVQEEPAAQTDRFADIAPQTFRRAEDEIIAPAEPSRFAITEDAPIAKKNRLAIKEKMPVDSNSSK